MSDTTANHWSLVQLPNGKVVNREDCEPVYEDRYMCPDTRHSGGFFEPGECRICGQALVKGPMAVRWQVKNA